MKIKTYDLNGFASTSLILLVLVGLIVLPNLIVFIKFVRALDDVHEIRKILGRWEINEHPEATIAVKSDENHSEILENKIGL